MRFIKPSSRYSLGLLSALMIMSVLMWGCSESPVDSASSASTGGEQTMSFDEQLSSVIESAADADNGQSSTFQQELSALVDQSEFTEDESGQTAGASEQPKGIAENASQFFWAKVIKEPTTITKPGLYVVGRDFSTSGDGIVIKSNFVLLLMGNHTLTGPGAKEGRGIVIDGARYVVVVGGRLENFGIGVSMENTDASIVRYVVVLGADEYANPPQGIAPQIGTMLINSPYNHITRNSYFDVNLGIFVRGGGSRYNYIVGNRVVGGDHGLLAICYNPAPTGGDAGPSFDLVRFNRLDSFSTGIQTSAGSSHNKFEYNTISYFAEAYHDFNGSNTFVHNQAQQLTSPGMAALTLSFDGLTDLGPDFVYEGWVIVNGAPVSTGTFTVDGEGNMSQSIFWVDEDDLAAAVKFVLTIEPAMDPDPAPSSTHYLAGDFSGSSASLNTADPAAFGNDFMAASGEFILATPSTAANADDYAGGIWWLDPSGPNASLSLPTLPNGWAYEGWVVGPGGPVSTGRFTDPGMADSDGGGPTAGSDPTPPFPGQDFIDPFMSLIGYAAVITVEPMPDNSPMPFALKPLVDTHIDDVGMGPLQSMANNAAAFPTGMASR